MAAALQVEPLAIAPPPVVLRKSLGLCLCGKEPLAPNRKRGVACLAYAVRKARESYKARRAQGLCGYGCCPEKATDGHSMCDTHRERNTRKIMSLLRARKRYGLCRDCGTRPILGTKTRCLFCYQEHGGPDGGIPAHPLPKSLRKLIRQYWRLDRIDTRRKAAEEAVRYLRDERARYVLAMRQGLLDGIDHTLEDVAQELKVTRERIRQIESQAYRVLKSLDLDTSFRRAKDLQRPPLTSNDSSRRAGSESNRRKAAAHRMVKAAIERGEITRKPCERPNCKYKGKVIAHHADYDKPLDVEWLCLPHHAEAHGHTARYKPAENHVRQSLNHVTDGARAEYYNKLASTPPAHLPIRDLLFSIRLNNCLHKSGIKTLADLLKYSPRRLLAIKNLGRVCLAEAESAVNQLGYELSFELTLDT